ncbi:MAG: protein kinase [Desulfurococcales archaeon]|nr:protein kinase [Desulfurococcales archaeon]
MRKFISYDDIDAASKLFLDPIIFSTIILKQKKENILSFKNNYRRVFDELIGYSLDALRDNDVVYTVIKHVGQEWSIRILTYGNYIVAMAYEKGQELVVGREAFDIATRNIYISNPVVRIRSTRISMDSLPDQLKEHVLRCIELKKQVKPPECWVGKILYGLKIEKVVGSRGGFMYVLLGQDLFSKKYAIKIPKENIWEHSRKSVGKKLRDILRGVLNALEVSSIERDLLKTLLLKRKLPEELANELVIYRKYILRPRAIMMFNDLFNEEEYIEMPPAIIEGYADKGDLSTRIKKRIFDFRELLFISIRISGALALSHLLGIIHMDIKPHNILLETDNRELYGYRPLLTDFVGVPKVLNKEFPEVKNITIEYADPISLITGKADYSYDIYSLGITFFYAATGIKPRTRILINSIALKMLYGDSKIYEEFLASNPDMAPLARNLENLLTKLSSKTKEDRNRIGLKLKEVLEPQEKPSLELLRNLPSELSSIIIKSIDIVPSRRYRDGLELWISLREAIKSLGFIELFPKPG